MPQPQPAKLLAVALSEIDSISRRLENALQTVGEARAKQRTTIEEVFIFLAVGYLGISRAGNCVTIRAVTCVDVASLLRIPRETVRRKATNLADLNLITMTARGVVIEDLDAWRNLAKGILT